MGSQCKLLLTLCQPELCCTCQTWRDPGKSPGWSPPQETHPPVMSEEWVSQVKNLTSRMPCAVELPCNPRVQTSRFQGVTLVDNWTAGPKKQPMWLFSLWNRDIREIHNLKQSIHREQVTIDCGQKRLGLGDSAEIVILCQAPGTPRIWQRVTVSCPGIKC